MESGADRLALAEALGTVPLFADLAESARRSIATQMRVRDCAPGEAVVEQDATGGAVHVVLDGAAEVRRDGGLVRRLGRGDHFGEMSVLDNQPASATVVAVDALRVASLSSIDFRPLLHDHPEIAERVILSLVARLRGMAPPSEVSRG